MNFDDSIAEELAALAQGHRYRRLRHIVGTQGPVLTVDGMLVSNFSSNNYLGLADDPALRQAAAAAAKGHGVGAGSSRLIAGNLPPHTTLEAALARMCGSEACLLFSSGYQAHVGILPALCGEGDLILSDAGNHASIIDGCRLSRAEVLVYRHRDLAHLAELLGRRAGRCRRVLIVSDTVFSMTGQTIDAEALSRLAREYDAALLLDEAHALGVLGPEGRGVAADLPVELRLGTLGKALGAAGAFVCASQPIIDYLRNRCRSFIFSTAPALPTCAAAQRAVQICLSQEGALRRQALSQRIAQLEAGLRGLGLVAGPVSHITPLYVHPAQDELVMQISDDLLRAGVFLQGIRPPTVPQAMLRLTLSATHTQAQIEHLLLALRPHRKHLQGAARAVAD